MNIGFVLDGSVEAALHVMRENRLEREREKLADLEEPIPLGGPSPPPPDTIGRGTSPHHQIHMEGDGSRLAEVP